jgi:hypothetical protein
VSVAVGLRTPRQVAELAARYRRPVPEELWTALADQGLLDAPP